MTRYKYHLAKRGKWVCPECGKKTFVCYVDDAGNVLDESVGKCDRKDHCGYHCPPREYFRGKGLRNIAAVPRVWKISNRVTAMKPSFIDPDVFIKSLQCYDKNNFVKFLIRQFGPVLTTEMTKRYYIGTSNHWAGATIFWQIDQQNRVHAGKVMLYNPTTGKRVKQPFNHLTWAHSALKLDNFNLEQCLFGEHLLTKDDPRPVLVHESEKTAVIASVFLPDYISVAVGGCGNLTKQRCRALAGRDVILCPDNGQYQEWDKKKETLRGLVKSIKVQKVMETHWARNTGDDIADVFCELCGGAYYKIPDFQLIYYKPDTIPN